MRTPTKVVGAFYSTFVGGRNSLTAGRRSLLQADPSPFDLLSDLIFVDHEKAGVRFESDCKAFGFTRNFLVQARLGSSRLSDEVAYGFGRTIGALTLSLVLPLSDMLRGAIQQFFIRAGHLLLLFCVH